MYKVAVIVVVCSLLLVIPTLTWRNKVDDDGFDADPFQSDDPMISVDDVRDTIDNEATGQTNNNGAAFIKQRFHYNSIMLLNGRINDTLTSSYTYLILAHYFDRADVALPGFYKFCMSASETEHESSVKLMKYMNKRGGWLKLRRIVAEERDWKNGLEVMEYMLEHEKNMNANYLYTHKIAADSGDVHLMHFLEHQCIAPKVEFIKKLAEYITNLKSFTTDYNLSEYIFDEKL